MKMLSGAAMLLAAAICNADVITTVESDWTTYRVDITIDNDYSIFGGGAAGDVFHFYFDLNRAYLPYQEDGSDLDTEGGSFIYTRYGILNRLTEDPTDRVVFTESFYRGSTTWDFNGHISSGWTPYSVDIVNGELVSIGTWLGNFGIGGNDYFFYMTHTAPVTGHVTGIVDLGQVVQVPEPGTWALLSLGLLGLGYRARSRI